MARCLEKIEKELGYCEVNLEKERRARAQMAFMSQDIRALDRMIQLLEPHDALIVNATEAGVPSSPSREAFLAAGLLDLLQGQRELLEEELTSTRERFDHYSGFGSRRRLLREEKALVFGEYSGARFDRMRRLDDEFTRTERAWMESTGDAKNLDQAIVHIEGNLDYLKSARNFLVSAKGEYDLEAFRRAGFLTDLFRHSSVGRAREMVHGADRNLQLAQTQLCCVKRFGRKDRKLLPESGSYHLALVPFVEALYEDLFVHTQIQLTIQVVEAALADNLKTLGMLEAKREELLYELERIDTARTRLFQKMGAGQRVEMAM